VLLAVNITPGFLLPSSQAMEEAKEVVWNGSWWVLLGILSSVGLGTVIPLLRTTHQSRADGGCCALAGTGLHTFVLYLGPLIAKATIAATECNSTSFELYGPDRFLCPSTPLDHDVRFAHARTRTHRDMTSYS
jgi:hypothetical protein